MAEIKIEEKRRSWLPWIVGAVAAGALIWFFSTQNNTPSNIADRDARADSAAGTLAPPRDTAMIRRDSIPVPPPR